MRKLLFIATVAFALQGTQAIEPQVIKNSYVLAVSPDCKILASENDGTVKIINLETGEVMTFSGESVMGYSIGMGSPISEEHVIVGTTGNMAAYCKEGSWTELSSPYPENANLANGITPDGSRICGSIGPESFGIDEAPTPMEIPVVWNRNEDGTYGDPVILPYPATDYLGNVPQYVMAVAISADGNTVAGQVRDNTGFMNTLIYYTFEEGEWVMHNDFEKLANPEGIEIPPHPGDSPEMPSIYDFMTQEELDAYNAAVEEWEASGTYDYSTYPREEDYMSNLEYQQYVEAWEEYQRRYEQWEQSWIAYQEAIKAGNGHSLIFNNVLLSKDGKTAVSTGMLSYETGNPERPERESFTPIIFNLEDGSYTLLPDKGMNATYLAEDGTILAFDGGVYKPRQAWVYLPDDRENPVSMLQYFEQRNPNTAEWMKENMLRAIDIYDEFGDISTVTDFECSGTPFASPDLQLIVCATENFWDNTSDFESYLLPADYAGGLEAAVEMATPEHVQIFSLEGTLIYESRSEKNMVLPKGIYLVRTMSDKGVKTRKTLF